MIINKCIRIALQLNDWENVLWLKREMVDYRSDGEVIEKAKKGKAFANSGHYKIFNITRADIINNKWEFNIVRPILLLKWPPRLDKFSPATLVSASPAWLDRTVTRARNQSGLYILRLRISKNAAAVSTLSAEEAGLLRNVPRSLR